MRALRALLALSLGLLSGGCLRHDTGAVLLHFTEGVDLSPELVTYSSSSAAAAFIPDGQVLLSATSNQGVLQLSLIGPLITGATIELPPDQESVHFVLDGAAWLNQGGTIYVLSADPAIVNLAGIPMVPADDVTVGSFVFQGSGTFR